MRASGEVETPWAEFIGARAAHLWRTLVCLQRMQPKPSRVIGGGMGACILQYMDYVVRI